MIKSIKEIGEIKNVADDITSEVQKHVVGFGDITRSLIIALLVGGHVLMEGFPGTGKTLLATLFARTLGLEVGRIQSTSDLMPSDITGTRIYNPKIQQFEFKSGPIFGNAIVVDEINRAPPKTQSALLECMQEKQVSVDGFSSKLDMPFMVIATKNAIEFEGTFPLPEAQLDRFLFRLIMEYLDESSEIEIIRRKTEKALDVKTVVEKSAIIDAMNLIHTEIKAGENVLEYISEVVRGTSDIPRVVLGASPRASVGLLYAAKGYAAVTEGRKYIVPDDVKAVAFEVLNHRLLLRQDTLLDSPEAREGWGIPYLRKILSDSLDSIAVPI
ncbi:MAG: MoxR family ATPase [Nitrososphaerales archaeon]